MVARESFLGARKGFLGAIEHFLGARESFLGTMEYFLSARKRFLEAVEYFWGARDYFLLPGNVSCVPVSECFLVAGECSFGDREHFLGAR